MDETVKQHALYNGVSRFPSAWIWLVIVGLLFFWFVGWGWQGWGGWWFGRARAADMEPITGSNAAVLVTNDKGAHIGQTFFLHNVPVQRVVSNSVLWIGPNSRESSLLVLTRSTYEANHHPVTQGEHITINGVVKKSPGTNVAEQNWNLDSQDAQRVAQQQAYLQAASVEPTVQPNFYGNGRH